MTKPCTLVILAKQPLPGVVKTRLIPTLGAAGAARLAERMLRHALAEALRAAEVVPSLGVELCVAPEAGDPYWAALAGNRPLTISQQVAGDIGERMLAAVTRITARGEYAILMGADCPGLTASRIAEAIASLRAPGVDLVITPARDGGYVLIGMGETHGTLFRDMPAHPGSWRLPLAGRGRRALSASVRTHSTISTRPRILRCCRRSSDWVEFRCRRGGKQPAAKSPSRQLTPLPPACMIRAL